MCKTGEVFCIVEACKVENVSKVFDGVRALSNVSLQIETGERLAIVGPNGAGKTTLLNVLNGQHKVTSGKVYLFGKDITYLPAYARTHLGMGRSFQTANFFLNMKILDSMLLALHGVQASRYDIWRTRKNYTSMLDEAKELLERVQLWDKRYEQVGAISHGQQRKLDIAMSIASKPRLLLLDEPTAGLTADENAELANTISDLSLDRTVVFIDHNIDWVFDVAKRVVVMHYGEIIVEGHPDTVRVDPKLKEIYIGMEETGPNAGVN